MIVTEPLAGTAEIFWGAASEIMDDTDDEERLLLTELTLLGGRELEARLLSVDWLDIAVLEGAILAADEVGFDAAGVPEPPPEPPQEISVNNIKNAANRIISDEKFIVTPWSLFSTKMVTSVVKSKCEELLSLQ